MKTGHVYPILVRILEQWRVLPLPGLLASVGELTDMHEVELDGEFVQIDILAKWANAKCSAITVEAIAYGPASWHSERVSEKLLIPLDGSAAMSKNTESPAENRHVEHSWRTWPPS